MPARLPFWASSALARASSPRTSSEICVDRRVTSSPVVASAGWDKAAPRRGRLRGSLRRHGRAVPSPTCRYTLREGSRLPSCGREGRHDVTSASAAWQDVGVITQRPDSDRRRRAAAALQRLRPVLADEAERALGRAESVGFLARLDLWFLDVHGPLEALYGDDDGPDGQDVLIGRLVRLALAAATDRSHGAARDRPAPRGRPALVPGAPDRRLRHLHRPASAARSRRSPSGWTTSPSWA